MMYETNSYLQMVCGKASLQKRNKNSNKKIISNVKTDEI